jgi:hypothetical protein
MPRSCPSLRAAATLCLGVSIVASQGCSVVSGEEVSRATASNAAAVPTTAVDWKAVDAAFGRPGVTQPGEVHRYNFPRSDLTVTVRDARGDVVLRPALALGGWIAMHATGAGAEVMAMGDLVLTEDELARVMSRLQEGGVGQTAIHHHVMRESPRVLYMHVHARGDAVRLANTVREAVALTATPAASLAVSAARPVTLDTVAIAAALGHAGRSNGGVYQVSAPRPEVISDDGHPIPGAMGLGTVMNFQPTSNGRAAITGDFVMTAAEVNRVIRALRANGIEITSLHNHMLNDEPRLFFMHFWAHDDAVKLARGLRAGLDSTAIRPAMR